MTNSTTPNRDNSLIFTAVCACFLLSGFAALLYQIAWMRQLSIVFGTSELAVATVLAAYMAGLAAGAAIAARLMHRIRRPVLVYGVLEAAIAVSALSVPFLLQVASLLYGALFGGQPAPPDASGLGQSLFYLTVTFVLLFVPTACMGATLPMLTRYAVRSEEQIGPRVGLLYSINTVGAIGGTLVAAFLLLPALGLMGTIVAGAVVNLLVFLIAALLAQRLSAVAEAGPLPSRKKLVDWQSGGWILPVMLVSGFATFSYEVLWTRLLSHILGGSVVAFATMLASFLAGIALGSAIASRFASSRESSRFAFVFVQLAIATISLFIFVMLDRIVPDTAGLAGNVTRVGLLLLPATLFIGATFPFAVRIFSQDERQAAEASARVYAWNTVGAIAGALIAGFLLIPVLRYEGTIKFVVVINVLLAIIALLVSSSSRSALIAVPTALCLLFAAFLLPQSPEGLLRVSPIDSDRGGAVRFYDVGRSATVLVLERDGYFYLRTNGLPEALTEMSGAPPTMHSQRLLSTLPLIARPNAKNMLIVGFGGGVVAEGIPSSVQQIDIVELEPKVIEANEVIAGERNIDPLSDPRINIVINDARNALRLTDKQYDVVVSQPSHPWTAGASHLYTQEYMQLVKSRLSSDGVFLQWIDVQFLSEELLRSFAATLASVFPNVRAYQFKPNVLFFLSSDQPLEPELALATHGEPLASFPDEYHWKGISSVNDIVAALAWDDAGIRQLAANAPIITDNDNRMAMLSSRAFEAKALTHGRLNSLIREYGPLYNADSGLHKDLGNSVSYQTIGDRLAALKAPELMQALAEALEAQSIPDYRIMMAKAHRANGDAFRADRLLLSVLEQEPDQSEACYLLFFERRDQIKKQTVPDSIQQYLTCLEPDASAVIASWDASMRGDYQQARDLDQELVSATPEEPWYQNAAKLRAGWRIEAAKNGEPQNMAKESREIVDAAISITPDLDLYGMRMAAGFLLADYDAVVQSAQRMASVIANDLEQLGQSGKPNVKARNALGRRLKSISEALLAVRAQQKEPQHQFDAIDERIDDLQSKLKQN